MLYKRGGAWLGFGITGLEIAQHKQNRLKGFKRKKPSLFRGWAWAGLGLVSSFYYHQPSILFETYIDEITFGSIFLVNISAIIRRKQAIDHKVLTLGPCGLGLFLGFVITAVCWHNCQAWHGILSLRSVPIWLTKAVNLIRIRTNYRQWHKPSFKKKAQPSQAGLEWAGLGITWQ